MADQDTKFVLAQAFAAGFVGDIIGEYVDRYTAMNVLRDTKVADATGTMKSIRRFALIETPRDMKALVKVGSLGEVPTYCAEVQWLKLDSDGNVEEFQPSNRRTDVPDAEGLKELAASIEARLDCLKDDIDDKWDPDTAERTIRHREGYYEQLAEIHKSLRSLKIISDRIDRTMENHLKGSDKW